MRPLTKALIVTALVLLATVNERTIGTVTDEQVLLSTSSAIGHWGELGVAREWAIAAPRETGDAVAPYGVIWPAMLAPVMRAAGPWERAFGDRSSQSLFGLLPIALIVMASWGAGLLARELGASSRGEVIAALATALGSPLWAYASTVFTEPLQAALLVFAMLCSVRGHAARAGLLAGLAALAKSVNLALIPFILLPLLWPTLSRAKLARAALGIAAPLTALVAIDIARFGSPLASYAGQHFSHPLLDGLWRLLVGVNEGLLVYFPLVVLSGVGLVALVRSPERRGAGLAIAATSAALLVLMSAWWAWDGSSGWGPRLLMPIVPLLAAVAATTNVRRLAPALLALGIAVNLLGVLQADVSASFYVDSCGTVPVPDDEVAWYPDGLATSAPPGQRTITRSMAAPRDAAFPPIRTHCFLIRQRASYMGDRFENLQRPPWLDAHPDAIPRMSGRDGELSGVLLRDVTGALRWPHWLSTLATDDVSRRLEFHGAWRDASIDQILRALDMGRPDRAAALARPLWTVTQSRLDAALLAASLRESGNDGPLEALVRELPPEARSSPEMTVVLAQVAADRGYDDVARTLLLQAEPAFPTAALHAALEAPLSEWPRGYRDLTR